MCHSEKDLGSRDLAIIRVPESNRSSRSGEFRIQPMKQPIIIPIFNMRLRTALLTVVALYCSVVSALRTRLTWVNGIGYNEQHMQEDGRKISDIFGTKCWYCLNPTAMANDNDMIGYLNDLTQAGTQKLGRITEEVTALVKHLKEAVAFVGKKGRVIHIAHSQGALITFLAAKRLTPMEMNRIEVIAFGGAAALRKTPETPFFRCINYYSLNDPLLWVVPSAEQALRSGLVGDSDFVFLAPRIGDPIQDHHLLAPTYLQALSWEGQRYRATYQSVVYRLAKTVFTLVALFFRMMRTVLITFLRRTDDLLMQRIRSWLAIVISIVVQCLNTPRESQSPMRSSIAIGID